MSTENTETVISINHVSKVYKLFEKPMDRLKESLSLTHKNYHTDHFALEDISRSQYLITLPISWETKRIVFPASFKSLNFR